MNAELMQRACLELPPASLRIVAELVKALGGRLLKENSEEELVYIAPPIPESERVCRMLKGARLRAGMTQKELASAIGVPQSHISDYEKNKRRVPPQKAEVLATTLETVPSHFLYQD